MMKYFACNACKNCSTQTLYSIRKYLWKIAFLVVNNHFQIFSSTINFIQLYRLWVFFFFFSERGATIRRWGVEGGVGRSDTYGLCTCTCNYATWKVFCLNLIWPFNCCIVWSNVSTMNFHFCLFGFFVNKVQYKVPVVKFKTLLSCPQKYLHVHEHVPVYYYKILLSIVNFSFGRCFGYMVGPSSFFKVTENIQTSIQYCSIQHQLPQAQLWKSLTCILQTKVWMGIPNTMHCIYR